MGPFARNALFDKIADHVLSGSPINREQATAILRSPNEQLLSVLNAAFRVRHHFHGLTVKVHLLQNAKSGVCPEDCSFCSQSFRFGSPVERYGMLTVEQLVEGAKRAHESGSTTYCMVTATRGPARAEVETICEATRQIKAQYPLQVCASLGLLDSNKATALAEAGVDRYNHNLETSAAHYKKVCTTHTFDDRVGTIRVARQAGMEACAGGIIGLGEDIDDRVELAFTLRELEVESIPVNFFNPRPKTPLAKVTALEPADHLRTLAMFRLVHPDRDVRAAGGREVCLKHMQPLALYAANSVFTDGYLTTDGQESDDTMAMIRNAGFEPVVATTQ